MPYSNCDLIKLPLKLEIGWVIKSLNTLRPRQNGRHFADDTFNRIFVNENVRITIKFSLKFVPKAPINNIPALVQMMTWRRPGDKPLSEPMMVSLTTHICVTRPQWVKSCLVSLLIHVLGKPVQWKKPQTNYIISISLESLIARFMSPTWGPSGADRTQVGPMLAPWTLLSGIIMVPIRRWPNLDALRLTLMTLNKLLRNLNEILRDNFQAHFNNQLKDDWAIINHAQWSCGGYIDLTRPSVCWSISYAVSALWLNFCKIWLISS